jgi:DNA-binding NarL/FixJ family response regulator
MRVMIADDSMLLREGLARLLTEAGVDVVATTADATDLLARIAGSPPEVAIVDIRMPPTHTDEGIVAAQQIRRLHPEVGVLVLSQFLDSRYAMRLLAEGPESLGYLLKDRVSDVAVLIDALERIRIGECVLDPTIVTRMVRRKRRDDPMAALSDRERAVLELIAEGRTNGAIGRRLALSAKTVEAHVGQIFRKLDLHSSADDHRRVLAVLAVLRGHD